MHNLTKTALFLPFTFLSLAASAQQAKPEDTEV